MKKLFWLAIPAALLAIQFIQPDTSNPPVDPAQDFQQAANPPAEVQSILKEACYDCHSNETRYPWYSRVAPVSWWIADHVGEGREKLNFSTFGALSPKDRSEALDEAAEKVDQGEMPLASYTWLHPAARLTTAQRNLVSGWLNANGGEGGNAGASETGGHPADPGETGETDGDD